jgi:hypothetical protein
MDLFANKIDINQLLTLAVLVTGGALFYFRSLKDISIKLAVHDLEIKALFESLNSNTTELKEITKELHTIAVELAGKTSLPSKQNTSKPRRKS